MAGCAKHSINRVTIIIFIILILEIIIRSYLRTENTKYIKKKKKTKIQSNSNL